MEFRICKDRSGTTDKKRKSAHNMNLLWTLIPVVAAGLIPALSEKNGAEPHDLSAMPIMRYALRIMN